MYGPDESYIFFCRDRADSDAWIMTGKYKSEERSQALKHYAMQLKDHGMYNVLFLEVLRPTCISVNVLFDGEEASSQ